MTAVAENLRQVRARIAAARALAGRLPGVELVAVSKTHSAALVCEAFAAGQRLFGENRVQELAAKAAEVARSLGQQAAELQWHLIGSLQTNKVPDLLRVPGLALVHSLDRARLADELQRHLVRLDRRLDVLLQVHATDEPTKHGCAFAEAPALLDHVQVRCPNLAVTGVMAMAPLQGEPMPAFERTVALCSDLRARTGLGLPVLSLGMSSDFEAAIAAGSTLVRVGTAVFGQRAVEGRPPAP
ncbi:MAG TPA: YggS family pyridoxal phosphate-dependent enzyme [Planctomycetota bacterium]